MTDLFLEPCPSCQGKGYLVDTTLCPLEPPNVQKCDFCHDGRILTGAGKNVLVLLAWADRHGISA